MGEKTFYNDLWEKKKAGRATKSRDAIHRLIFDHLVNPMANDRIEVAAGMLVRGERILDLGIWGGTFLNLPIVKSKFPGRYGLDISSASVKTALESGIEEVQEWNLNVFPYPYINNFFDTISILAVVEHLFDPYNVILELHRLLKPGGQLIIALPNVASISNRIRLLLGHLPVTSLDPGWDGGHLHYFTISAACQLLEQNGFKVTSKGISGGLQGPRSLWPSLLAGEFILGAEKV